MMPRFRGFRRHGAVLRVRRARRCPPRSRARRPAPPSTDGSASRLASGAITTPDLCAGVLRRLTGVTRPIRNTVHADYAPFVLSKPQINPLETQQYLQYEDDAKTRPTLLMCKGKSADHIVAVYGPGAAQPALDTQLPRRQPRPRARRLARLTPAERAAARISRRGSCSTATRSS